MASRDVNGDGLGHIDMGPGVDRGRRLFGMEEGRRLDGDRIDAGVEQALVAGEPREPARFGDAQRGASLFSENGLRGFYGPSASTDAAARMCRR